MTYLCSRSSRLSILSTITLRGRGEGEEEGGRRRGGEVKWLMWYRAVLGHYSCSEGNYIKWHLVWKAIGLNTSKTLAPSTLGRPDYRDDLISDVKCARFSYRKSLSANLSGRSRGPTWSYSPGCSRGAHTPALSFRSLLSRFSCSAHISGDSIDSTRSWYTRGTLSSRVPRISLCGGRGGASLIMQPDKTHNWVCGNVLPASSHSLFFAFLVHSTYDKFSRSKGFYKRLPNRILLQVLLLRTSHYSANAWG